MEGEHGPRHDEPRTLSQDANAPPKNVQEEAQKNFATKPENERNVWNQRFNSVANKLSTMLERPNRTIIPKPEGDNYFIGSAKSYARGAEGAAKMITRMELSALLRLAELGAKVTGGRKA